LGRGGATSIINPEYQGRGIGTACIRRIIEDAVAFELPVRLRVLKVNSRAITFYQRLGFRSIGESDTHVLMERLSQQLHATDTYAPLVQIVRR
jgi:ribosomal protein S18 acetylase RimI-like enzyme